MEAVFTAEGGQFFVTDEVKQYFNRDGYILVKKLFAGQEVDKLKRCMEESKDIQKHAYGRSDGQGAFSRMCLWLYAGDDVSGVISRTDKIAGTMETLLGGEEVYHYHTKLMMKEPRTGGAHQWHQDYGYWYQYGNLTPNMGSVFMPVDRCTRQNSCLQILVGSHKMGRINHVQIGDQAGADLDRVELAKEKFAHKYVEMEPGDVLFFHSNLLHTSDQNKSDMRRYAMISAYNQAQNSPKNEHYSALYHPLNKLPNSAIGDCQKMDSSTDKCFMNPENDTGAASLKK